jgi:class 3 adenylate cyclase
MTKKGIRMLAAIMFTDIVGYTALMQEDELNAITLRDRSRKVLEDCSLIHQGRSITVLWRRHIDCLRKCN